LRPDAFRHHAALIHEITTQVKASSGGGKLSVQRFARRQRRFLLNRAEVTSVQLDAKQYSNKQAVSRNHQREFKVVRDC